uniref:RNA helicase n=1 Tax=Cacopsylla melanoneura TaxID=428564 RepID=A0A8D9E224_9HEMI
MYTPNHLTSNRSEGEVEDYLSHHDVTVKGSSVPRPIQHFEECNFPPYIMKKIHEMGFTAPTAIQAQGWPIALSGVEFVPVFYLEETPNWFLRCEMSLRMIICS